MKKTYSKEFFQERGKKGGTAWAKKLKALKASVTCPICQKIFSECQCPSGDEHLQEPVEDVLERNE